MYLLHGKKWKRTSFNRWIEFCDISNGNHYAVLYNIYKKSLPPEKTLRLNIYVSGTDGILYGASRERVDRGKTRDRGWSGEFVGQIAEGRRQRDKRME